MGYLYGPAGELRCGICAADGAVKRLCPYKVDGLRYCIPQAMCSRCYREAGGLRGVHGDKCRDGAAAAQAGADADRAALAAGDLKVESFGFSHPSVPDGMYGVLFSGPAGKEWRLVYRKQFHGTSRRTMTAFPDAQPWAGHPS